MPFSERTGKIPKNWQKRLPDNSSPYTFTIVFLVRKGNPKHIKDWDDLVKPGIEVATRNPKTSGGARWNYLAAWAYASEKDRRQRKQDQGLYGGSIQERIRSRHRCTRRHNHIRELRSIGDVLIAWENEAYLVLLGRSWARTSSKS